MQGAFPCVIFLNDFGFQQGRPSAEHAAFHDIALEVKGLPERLKEDEAAIAADEGKLSDFAIERLKFGMTLPR
jgi:hypothetical protein